MNKDSTNLETLKHITTVRDFLDIIIQLLMMRGMKHDKSKMEEPELSYFAEYTAKLKECTYGSEEYKKFLEEMKPALDHHYANNSHHPEHFKDGINDMNLVDLIEMFCDWKAATLRHNDGNLKKSIEHNSKRFNMDTQLTKIFENSIRLFDK